MRTHMQIMTLNGTFRTRGGALSASGRGRVRPVRCENSFTPTVTLKQVNEGNWSTFEVSVTQSSRYTIKKTGLCWSNKANSSNRITVAESTKKDGTFQVSIGKVLSRLETMYLSAFAELSDGTIVYSNEMTLLPHKPIVDFSLLRKDDATVKAIIDIKDWGFPELFDYIDVRLTDNQNTLSSAKKLDIKEDVYHYEEEWSMVSGTLYLVFNPFSQSCANVNAVFSATIDRETKAAQVKTCTVSDKTAVGLDANTNIVYSMTLSCELLDIGYPEAKSCGLVASLNNPSPSIDQNEYKVVKETSWSQPLAKGLYSFNDFQLTPNGPLYVRAFAINDNGISYGDVISVSFIEPSMSSVLVSNISTSSALVICSIINAGDPQYSERGFVYLTTNEYNTNPDIAFKNHKHQSTMPNSSLVGSWDMSVKDLQAGTNYVVYAYVSEGGVIWFSQVQQFSTYSTPVVKTLSPEWAQGGTNAYYITFKGIIENQSTTHYVERGFAYGYGSSIEDAIIVPITDSSQAVFSTPFSSKNAHNGYICAYAITADGEVYMGNRVLF